jgi:GMP synthase-like glutamine amidotransferase/nucleotide-binding universal stress UspA family protein
MRRHIAVLAHEPETGLGAFAPQLQKAEVSYEVLHTTEGKLRDYRGFDGTLALGGSLGVHDARLLGARDWVRDAVLAGQPFLGVCLGGQLLASALGARVARGRPEVGVHDVFLTRAAEHDPLFAGLPARLPVLGWHEDCFELPAGAVPLAGSVHCTYQAFRLSAGPRGSSCAERWAPRRRDYESVTPSGRAGREIGVEPRSRLGTRAATLASTERRDMHASIVCGVDGSVESEAALHVAARLADRLELGLVVAHVAEPAHVPYAAAAPFGGIAGRSALMEEVESQEEAAERLLEQVVVAAGVDAERRTALGDPAERLAEIADEVDAELIVVGSRGRGAFKSAFLGSVSNALVGVARCPVLIVPPGATETA